ncbi:sensor histidine kinase [Paenibacillus pini]
MKLFISYLILIIIPIFIFGYIANTILVDSYRKQMNNNLAGTLQQIQDNIMYKLEDTQRITDLLYFDEKLPIQLQSYEEGWVNYQITKDYLLPKFRQVLDSTNRETWLTVFLVDEKFPEIYNVFNNVDPLKIKGRFFDVRYVRSIENKQWYRNFPEEDYSKTMQWRQIEDDAEYGRISLLRRLVDTKKPTNLKTVGFMRVSVYLSDIFQSVDYNKMGTGSVLLITGADNRVLYASGKNSPMYGSNWDKINVKDHAVISKQLQTEEWKLSALVPNTIIERETRKINILTLVICFMSFIVISIVAFGVSRFFSTRVSKVVSVLRLFQQGDFHKRVHYRGKDEFSMIATSLNKLGEQTEHLIEEVYVTKLKKKEAELEILQAQINPHFLYNTLSSISRLAKFGEVDKQHQMVMNLAKFYRLSLNEGQSIISIYKELEQVQAYIDIQQVKYGDRMNVQFDVDSDIVSFMTVKLILQPFIENVLEHAWCGDRIHIRVTGRMTEDCIIFQVMDDGNGMSSDMVNILSDPHMEANRGYGTRNVNDRLQLHYGKDYGVTLHSLLGIGTTVTIRIPKHRRQTPKSREMK